MKIILVRHGESEHNVHKTKDKNSPLTSRGKKQVEHLARKLKKYRISKIYSSDLIRAKETAKIISKIINVPISESLKELNEFPSRYVRAKIIHLINPKIIRLKRLLKKLTKKKEKDKTILIVAHGVTNRVIISYLLQFKISKSILRITQDNACINFISWNNKYKNWSAWSINDISHIPNKLRNSEELDYINIKQ